MTRIAPLICLLMIAGCGDDKSLDENTRKIDELKAKLAEQQKELDSQREVSKKLKRALIRMHNRLEEEGRLRLTQASWKEFVDDVRAKIPEAEKNPPEGSSGVGIEFVSDDVAESPSLKSDFVGTIVLRVNEYVAGKSWDGQYTLRFAWTWTDNKWTVLDTQVAQYIIGMLTGEAEVIPPIPDDGYLNVLFGKQSDVDENK